MAGRPPSRRQPSQDIIEATSGICGNRTGLLWSRLRDQSGWPGWRTNRDRETTRGPGGQPPCLVRLRRPGWSSNRATRRRQAAIENRGRVTSGTTRQDSAQLSNSSTSASTSRPASLSAMNTADVAPDGGEVPPGVEFEPPDGRLQLGPPGGEAAVQVVGRVVQRDRQLPDVLVEVPLVLPVAHERPHELGEGRGVQDGAQVQGLGLGRRSRPVERVLDHRPAIVEPRGHEVHPRRVIDDPFRLDRELMLQACAGNQAAR